MMRKQRFWKRMTALFAAALIAVSVLPVLALPAKADTRPLVPGAEGDAGLQATWRIFDKGGGKYHLEISGTGAMYGYDKEADVPWLKFAKEKEIFDSIDSIGVTEGITVIGKRAFYGFTSVSKIELSKGLTLIDEYAFFTYRNPNLHYINLPSTLETVESYGLACADELTLLTIPASVKKVGMKALNAVKIGELHYTGTKEQFDEIWWGYSAIGDTYKNNVKTGSKDTLYNPDAVYTAWTVQEEPVTPTEPTTPTEPVTPATSFTDVKEGAYYQDAVNWAKDQSITNGVSATQFGVGQSVTRGQVATFLYAYAGDGTFTGGPVFTDVEEGKYYTLPVKWLAAKGFAKGYGDGRFGPGDPVTRAQAVTFLRNLVNGSGGTATFDDVPAGSWFYNSVAWAVSKNITTGTGDNKFSPNLTCTREQFVTLLYKLDQAQ